MYDTLLQSDTLNPHGRSKADTRPGGVGLCKKPKDLIVSEREECEPGEGRDVYVLYFSQIRYRHMVAQK